MRSGVSDVESTGSATRSRAALEAVGFEFDESQRPIFFVRYPAQNDPRLLPDLFAVFRDVTTRWGRVAYLIDMTRFDPLRVSAQERRAFSEEFERHRSWVEATTIAEARVVRNRAIEHIITAVEWLARRKLNAKNFSSETEARAWIRHQVELKGG